MAIPRRTLGLTGLRVTALGYGAIEVRGARIWGGRPVTDEQAGAILNAVLDAGIDFIDTANDYGRSEEFIGRFISRRRSEYYLATKCGGTVVHRDDETDDTPHVWTRDNLMRGLDESLGRMRTDHVDLTQLHNPSADQATAGDLVDVPGEMRRQGNARWIGCSSTLPHLATYIEWGVLDVSHIPYSTIERTHENASSAAASAGAGVIDRGCVARGGHRRRRPLGEVRRRTPRRATGRGRVAHGVPAAVPARVPARLDRHRGHAEPRSICARTSPPRSAGHCRPPSWPR
ncbi:MAG TPA: aldo/keto reductase [Chthonomonadales bacterium]|nr:aldo/keto reductase [Chthonomonadales bacterium]